MPSHDEANQWIERLRQVAHGAAEQAELARERLAHAEADGDGVLATVLQKHIEAAEKAAQDVHEACDQLEKHVRD